MAKLSCTTLHLAKLKVCSQVFPGPQLTYNNLTHDWESFCTSICSQMILRNWDLEGQLNLAIFKFNSTTLAPENLSEFALARIVESTCSDNVTLIILWISTVQYCEHPGANPLSLPLPKSFKWFCGERFQRKTQEKGAMGLGFATYHWLFLKNCRGICGLQVYNSYQTVCY